MPCPQQENVSATYLSPTLNLLQLYPATNGCQTRDFWGPALGLCSLSPTFASKQLLHREYHLSSGQLQEKWLHPRCWAAHWALPHLLNPTQTIKCFQDFPDIFFRGCQDCPPEGVCTPEKNNERKSSKSAQLEKHKRCFWATGGIFFLF